jgi:hypothetical protein
MPDISNIQGNFERVLDTQSMIVEATNTNVILANKLEVANRIHTIDQILITHLSTICAATYSDKQG